MSKTGVPDYNLIDKIKEEKMESEYYNISARCHNCGGTQSIPYPKRWAIQKDIQGFLIDIREDQSKGGVLHRCIICECCTLKECCY